MINGTISVSLSTGYPEYDIVYLAQGSRKREQEGRKKIIVVIFQFMYYNEFFYFMHLFFP